MKKITLILFLCVLAGFAFSQCNPATISASANPFCPGDSSRICAPPGYTAYHWNTGDTTECITVTYAGNYFVTTTDNNSCTVVSNHLAINVYPYQSVSIVENGDTLASWGAVSYQWFFDSSAIPGATSAVYVVTHSANYSVEITDSNGCIALSNPVYVVVGPVSYGVSLDQGGETIACRGSIIVLNPVVTAGVPPYTYSYTSNGSPLSCYSCQNPTAVIDSNTVFSLVVTDANNQSVSTSVTYTVSADTGTFPQASIANTNINCANPIDTTVVSLINGLPGFVCNWGDGTSSELDSVAGVHLYTVAGNYIITLTSLTSCQNTFIDSVINNGVVVSFPQVTYPKCGNLATGKIVAAASGGTPPYTYRWDNGVTADSLTGIEAGVYALTVRDNASCVGQSVITLYDYDWNFSSFVNAVYPNCDSNGSVSILISGGYPPFTYLWNNADTTAAISGLQGGFYSLSVTDSLGCSFNASSYLYANCYGIISGTVFLDSSGNCQYNVNDPPAPNVLITASQGGNSFYGYSDNFGHYSINVTGTGTFVLTGSFFGYDLCAASTFCNGATATIASPGDSSLNNNISITGSNGFNLGLHPGWLPANPGFTKDYWAFYFNSAITPYNGPATITFTYDSNLVYQSSLQPYPSYNPATHTLTWQLNGVPPVTEFGTYQVNSTFLVPANLDPGYQLQSTFTITPVIGDCDRADNYFHYSDPVTGSHDPNGKTVSPADYTYEDDSVLTYTIHFQNNGTDSTHFIIVKDTLPAGLNPATVRNIASSPLYSSFNISGQGILTWTFNPLRLVDSATNPIGSKGFVMFTINKNPDRAVGTVISNKASIYFDYNAPVTTNTAADTVAISGITTVSNILNPSLQVSPNPSTGKVIITVIGFIPQWLTLYDVNGREINQQKFTNQLDISNLANGIYFVAVKNANISLRQKVVKFGGQ